MNNIQNLHDLDGSFIGSIRTIPYERAKRALSTMYSAYMETPVCNDKEMHQDIIFIMDLLNEILEMDLKDIENIKAMEADRS